MSTSLLLSGSPPTSPKGTADSLERGDIHYHYTHEIPHNTAMDPQGTSGPKQNQVGTVNLRSVPIVSLHIDGQERLCLAQISNTLLREFSYNEIHNRRVALGITCIQCTPVQLEILRRAGAMPVSSRRCGMITKREAERLVKSFLEDTTPPQLPDNFCFDVFHECGWGCRGSFMPSRYNSSRAKCIKCYYCNNYFSPNKFIFHCHKMPAGVYRHPDAANFNSWRRHLRLIEKTPSDDLVHAWEDVKAMFNGGSRKRLSSPGHSPVADLNENSIEVKRPRLEVPQYSRQQPYPYPMFAAAVGTNPYRLFGNMFPRPSHPAFPFMSMEQANFNQDTRKINPEVVRGKMHNPYSFLWGKSVDLASEQEKLYANKMSDEYLKERSLESMRSNMWPEFVAKEDSPSPPAIQSRLSPCVSGESSYSAFTPVKKDSELQRKSRKSKPRKGLKIGEIADSILHRNMLSSVPPNSDEDDDTVEVEASDDEIGIPREYFNPNLIDTNFKNHQNASTKSRDDTYENRLISDNSNSKETEIDAYTKNWAKGDIHENEQENAWPSASNLSTADEIHQHKDEQNKVLQSRLEEEDRTDDGELKSSEEMNVKDSNDNENSELSKERKVPEDLTEETKEADQKEKEDLFREMGQLHQLRARAEREYKAIEDVLASGDAELSQQELQKKLADAHDALLQFSSKMMSLTGSLKSSELKG